MNCEKYKDESTCETCKAGSYFTGITCIEIPNCAKTANSSCSICKSGFYIDNGSCKSVSESQLIKNCSIYSTDQKCSACIEGFTLDLSRTSCLTKEQVNNQVDPYCRQSFVNDGNFCSTCIEGYYLKNGLCTKCVQNDACLICNPIQPSECLLCKPRYFMANSTNGSCVLNGDIASQIDSRDPLENSSITRATIPMLGVIIILVLFNR